MKNLKIIYLLNLILLSLFFNSCSNTPSTLKCVPESTPYVSITNVGSLLKKGHLDSMEKLEEFRSFKRLERLSKEDRDARNFLNEFKEDPRITGINLFGDVISFPYILSERTFFVCNTFELKDADKFKDFVEKILKKGHEKYETNKKNGLEYFLIGKGKYTSFIVGWDKNRALIMTGSGRDANIEEEFVDLMTLKEDKSILKNKSFKEFLSDRKDVSMWFSLKNLDKSIDIVKYYPRELRASLLDALEKGYAVSAHLSFENDQIKLSSKILSNKELDLNKFYNDKFNSDVLKYLPNKSYFVASGSLATDKIYDYFKDMEIIRPTMEDEFKKEFNIDSKELATCFKGTGVFNVHGYDKISYTYLGYGYKFDETKAEKIEPIVLEKGKIYLNFEEIERLNKGENVGIYGDTSINIKNVLEKGGNLDTAIENKIPVNTYKGGLDFGRYVPRTKEKEMPLFAFVTDLNDSSKLKTLFNNEKVQKGFAKKDGYYQLHDNDLIYISFNDDALLVTNDLEVINKFKKGGFSDDLSDIEIASDLKNNLAFMNLNLNFDSYPETIKKLLKDKSTISMGIKAFMDFSKNIEMKVIDSKNSEIVLKTENTEENSLYNLLKLIDNQIGNLR